jgi:hypothetical protein
VSIDWTEVTGIADTISGIAVATSLILVAFQLRGQRAEEFVSGSSDLFQIWSNDDFQQAVQWVIYDLHQDTWRAFVAANRGKYGERAFTRVGAFYNRVGYLVTGNLLGGLDQVLLETTASYAIRVWSKIEPLVLEARLVENSRLFQDFERMLPDCLECFVPGQLESTTDSTANVIQESKL